VRPVLLTAVTAILGVLPIAFGVNIELMSRATSRSARRDAMVDQALDRDRVRSRLRDDPHADRHAGTWVTIAAVMVGTGVMVSGGDTEGALLGDVFAGIIALSLAGAIVTTRSNPHIGMLPATCLGVGIAALVALPFAAPLAVSAHDLPIMLFFGAVQLSLGLVLFVAGVRLIPAAHSALLGMIEPIFGPLWVWIAVGEEPATTVLIGGAIVILSVAAKTLADARPRPDVPMA
jgi:drug/metabolite transporter (DMT)-like permease